MSGEIFLSAGIPDARRSPRFAQTADTVAITAAVAALIHVVLGRRRLVWGGHPAITPMIWIVAEELGVEYGSWVTLYQSRHFRDEYPEDNRHFNNVRYTDDIDNSREKSLREMRERMFSEHKFSAAVFIGGMDGIVQEFDMLRKMQPSAALLPLISSGGAAREVAEQLRGLPQDLASDMDYVGLFHRRLGVSVREERYPRPSDQPKLETDRFWKR